MRQTAQQTQSVASMFYSTSWMHSFFHAPLWGLMPSSFQTLYCTWPNWPSFVRRPGNSTKKIPLVELKLWPFHYFPFPFLPLLDCCSFVQLCSLCPSLSGTSSPSLFNTDFLLELVVNTTRLQLLFLPPSCLPETKPVVHNQQVWSCVEFSWGKGREKKDEGERECAITEKYKLEKNGWVSVEEMAVEVKGAGGETWRIAQASKMIVIWYSNEWWSLVGDIQKQDPVRW